MDRSCLNIVCAQGYKGQREGQAHDSSGTIKMWTGGMMSTFSNEVADWNGTGYGPMLMTPSVCSLFPNLVFAQDSPVSVAIPLARLGPPVTFCVWGEGGWK
jgi:hypothetical protein